jgi:hypothetical protein
MEVVEMATMRRNWRTIVVAASACAVVATVTTAMSASASPAGRAGLTRDIARSTAPANGNESVAGVIDQLSPSVGFIGLGDSATSITGRAELVRTTDSGRTFANIGPRTASDTEPDNIFLADPVPQQLDPVPVQAGPGGMPPAHGHDHGFGRTADHGPRASRPSGVRGFETQAAQPGADGETRREHIRQEIEGHRKPVLRDIPGNPERDPDVQVVLGDGEGGVFDDWRLRG